MAFQDLDSIDDGETTVKFTVRYVIVQILKHRAPMAIVSLLYIQTLLKKDTDLPEPLRSIFRHPGFLEVSDKLISQDRVDILELPLSRGSFDIASFHWGSICIFVGSRFGVGRLYDGGHGGSGMGDGRAEESVWLFISSVVPFIIIVGFFYFVATRYCSNYVIKWSRGITRLIPSLVRITFVISA